MKKPLFVGLFLLQNLLAFAGQPGEIPDKEIIRIASQPQFHCVAQLLIDSNSKGSCVLISPKYALTAAHEFINYNKKGVKWRKNEHLYTPEDNITAFFYDEKSYKVKRIIYPPGFLDSNATGPYYDIAIIEFEKSVNGVIPARLNSKFDEVGFTATGLGFGNGNVWACKPYQYLLKYNAGENVIDSLAGIEYEGKKIRLVCDYDVPNKPESNLTGDAHPLDLEYLINGGDSGGGLFIQRETGWELVGIHSMGRYMISMDGGGSTSEATRVSVFYNWIVKEVKIDRSKK